MMMHNGESVVPPNDMALAELLRSAALDNRPITPIGAGTQQYFGYSSSPDALLVSTQALNHIVEYSPADLTMTVAAGAALGDIQATLAAQRQWLPWDPPAPPHATIGGLLASGVSGPLRLGYGTPRDWTLGMRVALVDGRVVKSGGRVVKNVAGYDMHKLHLGALGTLGMIVEATFKLAPLPDQLLTLVLRCATSASALRLAERLRERPLAPLSLALLVGLDDQPGRASLAVRFGGTAGGITRQRAEALRGAIGEGATVEILDGADEAAFWRRIATFNAAPAGDDVFIIRAGARPSALGDLLDALHRHLPGETTPMVGYAGIGIVYARWNAPQPAQVSQTLTALRAALASHQGYAVVEYAPRHCRADIDLWGPPPATIALMRALRQRWDPNAILNRGRYLV